MPCNKRSYSNQCIVALLNTKSSIILLSSIYSKSAHLPVAEPIHLTCAHDGFNCHGIERSITGRQKTLPLCPTEMHARELDVLTYISHVCPLLQAHSKDHASFLEKEALHACQRDVHLPRCAVKPGYTQHVQVSRLIVNKSRQMVTNTTCWSAQVVDVYSRGSWQYLVQYPSSGLLFLESRVNPPTQGYSSLQQPSTRDSGEDTAPIDRPPALARFYQPSEYHTVCCDLPPAAGSRESCRRAGIWTRGVVRFVLVSLVGVGLQVLT